MQTTAIRTVANSLPPNEVILLTPLISRRYIPYTDLQKIFVFEMLLTTTSSPKRHFIPMGDTLLARKSIESTTSPFRSVSLKDRKRFRVGATKSTPARSPFTFLFRRKSLSEKSFYRLLTNHDLFHQSAPRPSLFCCFRDWNLSVM